MDELDRKIKNILDKRKSSSKYDEMIESTMKMIENGKVSRKNPSNVVEFKPKKRSKFLKLSQAVAAVVVVGVLGVTTYAGVTRKIRF